jgi:uncharacterized protein DUF5615
VLPLVSDENFNGDIVRGLLRRSPELDLVRVQDVGLSGTDDPAILEWAAGAGRIVLTHDRRTVPRFAYERLQAGLPLPGVFVVDDSAPVGKMIEEILLAVECGGAEDWKDQVTYFPL